MTFRSSQSEGGCDLRAFAVNLPNSWLVKSTYASYTALPLMHSHRQQLPSFPLSQKSAEQWRAVVGEMDLRRNFTLISKGLGGPAEH